MSTSEKSLWGTLPEAKVQRTPVAILRSQAEFLERETNGLLVGEVITNDSMARLAEAFAATTATMSPGQYSNRQLSASLDIVAPSLNRYRYRVLTIRHTLEYYPLRLENPNTILPTEVKSEKEFEEALGAVLQSTAVQRAIAALLGQIAAADRGQQ